MAVIGDEEAVRKLGRGNWRCGGAMLGRNPWRGEARTRCGEEKDNNKEKDGEIWEGLLDNPGGAAATLAVMVVKEQSELEEIAQRRRKGKIV